MESQPASPVDEPAQLPDGWTHVPEACRLAIIRCMDTPSRRAWRLVSHQSCMDVHAATQTLSWSGQDKAPNPLPSLPTVLPSTLPSLPSSGASHEEGNKDASSSLPSLGVAAASTASPSSSLEGAQQAVALPSPLSFPPSSGSAPQTHPPAPAPCCPLDSLLPKLPHLLHLNCWNFNSLRSLSNAFPAGLLSLDLSNCPNLQTLHPLHHCTSLQHLTLRGTYTHLPHLARSLQMVAPALCPSLAHLTIAVYHDVPQSAAEALFSALLPLTRLQHLRLCLLDSSPWGGGSPLPWPSLASALEGMRDLRTLDLGGSCMGAAAAEALAPALARMSRLCTLRLPHNRMRDEGASAVAAALASLPATLTHLDLAHNEIAPGSAPALGTALCTHAATLVHLDLSHNPLKQESAEALAPGLGACSALTSLVLTNTGIGGRGATALSPSLLCLTSLKALDLRYCGLGADGGAAIEPALATLAPSLVSLQLGYNSLGSPECIARLAPALSAMTALTRFEYGGQPLRPVGAASLAPVLASMMSLRHLDLPSNALCPAGLATLLPVLQVLPTLGELNIAGSGLGEEGAGVLAAGLTALTALTVLQVFEKNLEPKAEGLVRRAAASMQGLQLNL